MEGCLQGHFSCYRVSAFTVLRVRRSFTLSFSAHGFHYTDEGNEIGMTLEFLKVQFDSRESRIRRKENGNGLQRTFGFQHTSENFPEMFLFFLHSLHHLHRLTYGTPAKS
jgi:hypothetical protein